MKQRLRLQMLGLLFGASLLLSSPATPQVAALQTSAGCSVAAQAPGSADQAQAGSTGEQSLDQKHAAFDEVLAAANGYGDYRYPVAVTKDQQTVFAPLLLKSVAGIESDWTQYNNGQTNVNTQSCDFGLMQLNEQARAALFTKQPSLRSDTRGNIAAGAQTLSELWSQGLFGNLPLVNDGDPTWLTNWYYVLSTYNGGPGGGVWINNPACRRSGFVCQAGGINYDYSRSRPNGLADWKRLGPDDYPYQERVLYNLAFARPLSQQQNSEIAEWQAAGLGLQQFTGQRDTGIRPEDSVFVRPDPTTGELVSFAPNLLLFRHRASRVAANLNAQWIFFEYDLPFSAQVTLTLQLQDGSERPLCTRAGVAGWNRHFCQATVPLQPGDAYRLRAERGTPEQPADYYLGQYLQEFHFVGGPQQVLSLTPRTFLPLVQNTGRSVGLLNSDFSREDPLQGWQPDFWDAQVLLSRPPNGLLPNISTVIQRSKTVLGWQLSATPGGVIELRQRLTLELGSYLLKVRLNVQANDAASVLHIRTRPAVPGPQPWSPVVSINAAVDGALDNEYRMQLDGPTTFSLQAAFGPDDAQSAFVLRSVELFR